MAMTQFAMVEELASLIKDNLYSKHLILSTEEALIDSLQDDASVGAILELQPTSPYHRLLLHRLADIYGFAHESVGDGDDRHLVLQRCPETATPSVLVSDILWQYDDGGGGGNDFESPTSSLQMLRREDDFVVKPMQSLTLSARLEERETAYREARNRIFAPLHDTEEKDDGIVPKTRKVPVVARRMIAHALGQRIPSPDEKFSSTRFEENAVEDSGEKSAPPSGKPSSWDIKLSHESSSGSISCNGAGSSKSSKSKSNSIGNESSNGRAAGAENMQKEQTGAAKRIFAHALRLPSAVSASTRRVNERGRALRRET